MSALINISIDLSKIDKKKIVEGKNGAKYYNLTIGVNDETNEYGKNVSVFEPQTKEERDNKKEYLGGGSVFWENGIITKAKKKESGQSQSKQADFSDMDDDLPF